MGTCIKHERYFDALQPCPECASDARTAAVIDAHRARCSRHPGQYIPCASCAADARRATEHVAVVPQHLTVCLAGRHNLTCTEGCTQACKKLMRGERSLPTFDEWFRWKHGASFEQMHMGWTMEIHTGMEALAIAMRDYVSDMVRS